MTIKTTIDKAGRLVIPKSIRRTLHLHPGDEVQLESSEDQLTLTPVHAKPALRKEKGVWVFHSETSAKGVSIPELIDDVREQRNRDSAG
jgi:AbrB family looped-hinge helix DNA binding protein